MRIFERLDELYAIGGGQGANRRSGSAGEQRAHDLVSGWLEEAGFEVERDSAANLIGRLRGTRPDLPELWAGSHLDSVPEGGRLDGPLGVLGGLEAVERIGPGERTLAVVAFRGEEVGCIGSRARVAEIGELPGAFVELHIEQGPRLEHAGVPLGVVTAIVGYSRQTVTITGRVGHAGTTPMDNRDDALCEAAERVLAIRNAARAIPEAVATVGVLTVAPGGVNVIPGSVSFTVDVRAPDRGRLDRLLAAIGLETGVGVEPTVMDATVVDAVKAAIASLDVTPLELPSGAGHDAGILAAAGVPSAMLFVRSLNGGVSHSPAEHSSDEDILLAVDALERTLRDLGSV
ncbi:MAG: Zn-dependent hydrolase [Gaiellaceae bacterium MAG52_C11]|nr:Zn-dependent hydrolase [Candidatus Gaiellasilicea maunaloa]